MRSAHLIGVEILRTFRRHIKLGCTFSYLHRPSSVSALGLATVENVQRNIKPPACWLFFLACRGDRYGGHERCMPTELVVGVIGRLSATFRQLCCSRWKPHRQMRRNGGATSKIREGERLGGGHEEDQPKNCDCKCSCRSPNFARLCRWKNRGPVQCPRYLPDSLPIISSLFRSLFRSHRVLVMARSTRRLPGYGEAFAKKAESKAAFLAEDQARRDALAAKALADRAAGVTGKPPAKPWEQTNER